MFRWDDQKRLYQIQMRRDKSKHTIRSEAHKRLKRMFLLWQLIQDENFHRMSSLSVDWPTYILSTFLHQFTKENGAAGPSPTLQSTLSSLDSFQHWLHFMCVILPLPAAPKLVHNMTSQSLHEASRSFPEHLLQGQIHFANTSKHCSFQPVVECSGTHFCASDCVGLPSLGFGMTLTSRHWPNETHLTIVTMAHFAAHYFILLSYFGHLMSGVNVK